MARRKIPRSGETRASKNEPGLRDLGKRHMVVTLLPLPSQIRLPRGCLLIVNSVELGADLCSTPVFDFALGTEPWTSYVDGTRNTRLLRLRSNARKRARRHRAASIIRRGSAWRKLCATGTKHVAMSARCRCLRAQICRDYRFIRRPALI